MCTVRNGTRKGNVIYCSALFFIDKKKKKKFSDTPIWPGSRPTYYAPIVLPEGSGGGGSAAHWETTDCTHAHGAHIHTRTHTHARARARTRRPRLGVNGPTELLDRGRKRREYFSFAFFRRQSAENKYLSARPVVTRFVGGKRAFDRRRYIIILRSDAGRP